MAREVLNIISKKKTTFIFFPRWKIWSFQPKILVRFFHPRREGKQIPLFLLQSQVHCWHPERGRLWKEP